MIFKVKFKVTQMDSSKIYDWSVVVLIMKHTGSLTVIELLQPGMTYFGHEKKIGNRPIIEEISSGFKRFCLLQAERALWDRPNIELQCQSVYIKLQNPSKIQQKFIKTH